MTALANMNEENQPATSRSASDLVIKEGTSVSHSRVASSVVDLSMCTSTPKIDRLISDDMGSEILQVIVGPEKKVFSVHKDLLLPTGPAFMKAFDPLTNPKKRITMSKEDPETFKLFVEIIYTRQVPAVLPAMSENGKAHRLIGLCRLYVFAEGMQITPLLRNQIFDKIQDGFFLLNELPVASLISSVYSHTVTSSKFRKFIAACLVFQVRSTPNLDLDMVIGALKANDEIMKDFLVAVHDFMPGQDPRIRSASGYSGFVEGSGAHLSNSGEPCTPGVSPCAFHVPVDVEGEELSATAAKSLAVSVTTDR